MSDKPWPGVVEGSPPKSSEWTRLLTYLQKPPQYRRPLNHVSFNVISLSVDEMPQEPSSYLSQLACGKIGVLICHFTQSRGAWRWHEGGLAVYESGLGEVKGTELTGSARLL